MNGVLLAILGSRFFFFPLACLLFHSLLILVVNGIASCVITVEAWFCFQSIVMGVKYLQCSVPKSLFISIIFRGIVSCV